MDDRELAAMVRGAVFSPTPWAILADVELKQERRPERRPKRRRAVPDGDAGYMSFLLARYKGEA